MKSMFKTLGWAVLLLSILLSACRPSSHLSAVPGTIVNSSKPGESGAPNSVLPTAPIAEEEIPVSEIDNYKGCYLVNPESYEAPLPEGMEIPISHHDHTLEDDILNSWTTITHVSDELMPYYESPHFEYGHQYEYQVDYIGAFCLTTLDGTFDSAIVHRYDSTLVKDGLSTGETWRFYVTTGNNILPYFYDEPAGMLYYVQILTAITKLYGDESIRWYGMTTPEQARENTDNALMAYEQFIGGPAQTVTLSIDECAYIIPPSSSDEDWYDRYYFSKDGSNWGTGGVLDGLIYINCADPTLWQVFDDQTHSYRELRLEGGLFEEVFPMAA